MAKITTEGTPVKILPFRGSASFPVSVSGHLILVFKDDDGNEFAIQSGPSDRGDLPPWGEIDMWSIGDPLDGRENKVDGSTVSAKFRGSTEVDFGDRDVGDVWNILLQHAENIQKSSIPYKPFTTNSNAVIGSLLDVVGINVIDFEPDPRGIMLDGYIGKNIKLTFNYRLDGTDADDILRGRGGRQKFFGGDGDDRLKGGNGPDRLAGDAGDDVLRGGRGADVLVGGDGRDRLFGGGGEDVFVFKDAGDSGLGAASDRISGFTPGEDHIDLARLGVDLTFETGGFTGTAPSLYLKKVGTDRIDVMVDIDGDAAADMRIVVKDVIGLGADDFVF